MTNYAKTVAAAQFLAKGQVLDAVNLLKSVLKDLAPEPTKPAPKPRRKAPAKKD